MALGICHRGTMPPSWYDRSGFVTKIAQIFFKYISWYRGTTEFIMPRWLQELPS
ncbi:hypothetical protein A2U01_0053947, partial [Trifolium medium]|nr:hypothetical protein [Trifolium medium]